MNRCPNCGRYMSSYMEYIFGGVRLVWTCECGYSTKDCTTGMSMDTKTYMVKNPKIITTRHT